MKLFKIDDTIKLGYGKSNEWKFRYYERYYNVSNSCMTGYCKYCKYLFNMDYKH